MHLRGRCAFTACGCGCCGEDHGLRAPGPANGSGVRALGAAGLKKAVLAILIAGDAVVLINNVAKPVDSAALCAVLTSANYSDRVLGVSQKVTVPTNATWLLTGNSIEFVGDLTTRVLLSVLDPEVEHPEERPFRRNLAEYIIEHRGDLVSAALTIPLAYLAAGSPAVKARR